MSAAGKVFADIFLYGLEKFGLFYSRYRAFVVNNNDPDGRGRLQLQIPQIHGDHKSKVWALPASVFSGPGYGIQLIPPINGVVWVSFEFGNPRRPLWHHGYYAKDAIPTELRNVKKIWFKSVKGFLVEIDDTSNTLRIIGQGEEEEEPLVLGNTLETKLDTLIGLLLQAKTNTAMGPQPLFNILVDLQSLKDGLSEIKSTNKTIGK